MNTLAKETRIRWSAVKIFGTPPLFVSALAVLLFAATDSVRNSLPFIIQVVAGLGTVMAAAYSLALIVAGWSAHSLLPACAFGVFLCAIGTVAFGLAAGFGYEDFSLSAFVLPALFWFAFFGFPIAALTGLVFRGAVQRLETNS